jgi:hypothetical protein
MHDHAGSAATNKLYQLQQEVEGLRSASANNSGASKERDQEQKYVIVSSLPSFAAIRSQVLHFSICAFREGISTTHT